jgi:cytochrome c oxidase subunit 4
MGDSHGHAQTQAGQVAHAAHDGHDLQATIRKYWIVFGSLIVGTILTVTMYYVHIPSVATTICVALFIASIKGSLVACYFMHLIDERKMIYSILVATVFFFAGLMALTLWAVQDPPSLTLHPAYQGK